MPDTWGQRDRRKDCEGWSSDHSVVLRKLQLCLQEPPNSLVRRISLEAGII